MPRKQGGDDQSWLSRIFTPLKWLGRKVREVFDALVSDHAGEWRKLGALVAAGMLAKRLPGPLRWLAGLVRSAVSGERGFGFRWIVVTLGIALVVGALVALLVSPVAGLLALLAVGIWMLVRARNKDGDEDRSDASSRDGNAGREPDPAQSPA